MIRYALIAVLASTSYLILLSGAEAADAEATDFVCMDAAAKTAGPARAFTIIAPAAKGPAMRSLGFADRSCIGKEGATEKYRNEICRLAATAPNIVKNDFEETYGISSDTLCDFAESNAGKWVESSDWRARLNLEVKQKTK